MQLTYPVMYLQLYLCYSANINIKFIAVPQISSKTGKQWTNKGSTELYCLFIAADIVVDAVKFIRCIVLWSQNKFSPNPDLK